MEELTAITKRGSACSGTAGVPRIWATATGGSEVGDELGEDVRGFWRGVARWSPLGSGWPELAPATTLAATGVRPKTNLTLEGSVRCGE